MVARTRHLGPSSIITRRNWPPISLRCADLALLLCDSNCAPAQKGRRHESSLRNMMSRSMKLVSVLVTTEAIGHWGLLRFTVVRMVYEWVYMTLWLILLVTSGSLSPCQALIGPTARLIRRPARSQPLQCREEMV